MNGVFFLNITFFMNTDPCGKNSQIKCIGSREIIKTKKNEMPRYILGMIEFKGAYIPVIDIGAAFEAEPINMDNSKCILIVEHYYKSQILHTGIIVQDSREIENIAAEVFCFGASLSTSLNLNFILDMKNANTENNEILTESHRMLGLLNEQKDKKSCLNSVLFQGISCNFINLLRNLNFLQRQIVLEELAKKTELWDKSGNIMCL